MDLKLAGTREGITALQLDVKAPGGIPVSLLAQAIRQSEGPLAAVLDAMQAAIAEPRSLDSPALQHLPRMAAVIVPDGRMGRIIGPGGAVINGIRDRTGCKLVIADKGEKVGRVQIHGASAEMVAKAVAEVEAVLRGSIDVGTKVEAIVSEVLDFGVVLTVDGSTAEGLCHVSELAWDKVEDVGAHIRVGDKLAVQVIASDPRGKLKFSRKACLTPPEGVTYTMPVAKRGKGGGKGGDGGRGGGGGRHGGGLRVAPR